MPKDYTQRRNERWETMFPGIGLESILGRILRIARYHNHKSTETMKPFGIKNGEADVLSALLHAGPPYTLNPKDITKHAYRTPGAITNVMDHTSSLKVPSRKISPSVNCLPDTLR